jgi:hypothetical protein
MRIGDIDIHPRGAVNKTARADAEEGLTRSPAVRPAERRVARGEQQGGQYRAGQGCRAGDRRESLQTPGSAVSQARTARPSHALDP